MPANITFTEESDWVGAKKGTEAFSVSRFFVVNTFLLTFLIAVYWAMSELVADWLGVPNRFWEAQITASFWQHAVVFTVTNLITCFFEYFFHRYVLHREAFPFLRMQYRAHHIIHHPSTRIAKRKTRKGQEILFLVENDYPITRPEQNVSAFFPWYTLLVFGLVFAPIFLLLQWLLPDFPWILTGNIGIFFGYSLYEVYHSIEHWPFERWERLLEHPKWGAFWTKVYGFHLRHHATPGCNETISGFFLLPIGDWLFGTYAPTTTLYTTGEEWKAENFRVPEPRWPIRLLDRIAKRMELKNRSKA